ncbi:small acid-soluble spore protein K [Alteribacter aurantiacus]|nr:small acid-soluble spore protein K [Alteribacter aurantiacus]
MRNKAKGFPNRMRFSKERRTDDEHQSKRANGEINDHPNARMNSSNNQQ